MQHKLSQFLLLLSFCVITHPLIESPFLYSPFFSLGYCLGVFVTVAEELGAHTVLVCPVAGHWVAHAKSTGCYSTCLLLWTSPSHLLLESMVTAIAFIYLVAYTAWFSDIKPNPHHDHWFTQGIFLLHWKLLDSSSEWESQSQGTFSIHMQH